MRKLLLIAVLTAGMCGLASAQEYKPGAGDFSLEVGFAPFGQNIINSGDLAGFIHFSDNLALRVGLVFGVDTYSWDKGETGDNLETEKTSSFKLALQPGIAYFFSGTQRLAPYIGAGLGIGFISNKLTQESGSVKKETTHYTSGDAFSFGLGAFTGFNYYVAQKLYIGAEVGLGLDYYSIPVSKVTYSGSNAPSTPAESKVKEHGMHIGLDATALLRLGWTF